MFAFSSSKNALEKTSLNKTCNYLSHVIVDVTKVSWVWDGQCQDTITGGICGFQFSDVI